MIMTGGFLLGGGPKLQGVHKWQSFIVIKFNTWSYDIDYMSQSLENFHIYILI